MTRFVANMGNALVTAFGTASSSASLPVTINSLETKNNIDPRISRSDYIVKYSSKVIKRTLLFELVKKKCAMNMVSDLDDNHISLNYLIRFSSAKLSTLFNFAIQYVVFCHIFSVLYGSCLSCLVCASLYNVTVCLFVCYLADVSTPFFCRVVPVRSQRTSPYRAIFRHLIRCRT